MIPSRERRKNLRKIRFVFASKQITEPSTPLAGQPNIRLSQWWVLGLVSMLRHICFLSPYPQVALVAKLNTTEDRQGNGESQSAIELAQEVSDLESQLEQREQALKQAHLDIETLTAELEVLDKQNQEATQVLFASF